MVAQGVTDFVEIGAGKALSGMIRRIAPDSTVSNVATPDDVAAVVAAIKG